MSRWIVEIEPEVWLAQWRGDPGRTLQLASAKRFRTLEAATLALAKARKYRQFLGAKILEAIP